MFSSKVNSESVQDSTSSDNMQLSCSSCRRNDSKVMLSCLHVFCESCFIHQAGTETSNDSNQNRRCSICHGISKTVLNLVRTGIKTITSESDDKRSICVKVTEEAALSCQKLKEIYEERIGIIQQTIEISRYLQEGGDDELLFLSLFVLKELEHFKASFYAAENIDVQLEEVTGESANEMKKKKRKRNKKKKSTKSSAAGSDEALQSAENFHLLQQSSEDETFNGPTSIENEIVSAGVCGIERENESIAGVISDETSPSAELLDLLQQNSKEETVNEQSSNENAVVSAVQSRTKDELPKRGFVAYQLEITPSYRKFGPPASWNGDEPSRSCMVSFSGVGETVTEEELFLFFKGFGNLFSFKLFPKAGKPYSGEVLFFEEETVTKVLEEFHISRPQILKTAKLFRRSDSDLPGLHDELHICEVQAGDMHCQCLEPFFEESDRLGLAITGLETHYLEKGAVKKLNNLRQINLLQCATHCANLRKDDLECVSVADIVNGIELLSGKAEFNEEVLILLHETLFPGLANKGQYRTTEDVIIHRIYGAELRPVNLDGLRESIDKFLRLTAYFLITEKFHPIVYAAFTTLFCLETCPFREGNRWISIILFNWMLKSKGDHPYITFDKDDENRFFEAMHSTENEHFTYFVHYIADVVLKSQKRYYELLKSHAPS